MKINTFKEMYLAELQELASSELQLGESLTRIVGKISQPDLKNVLLDQQEHTKQQEARLMSILRSHGADGTKHTDQGMQALVRETEKMLKMLKGDELRDAGLIASLQRLKHYEIAAYGTAATLASQLALEEDAKLLQESLDEEKDVDRLLTSIAERQVNPEAAAMQPG